MEEILLQAKNDKLSTALTTETSESYIYKGIKITRVGDDIKILNTKFNGDYYSEITKMEYAQFFEHGWRVGCYVVANRNNNRSLTNLRMKIQAETPGTRRHISLIKSTEVVIDRFLTTLSLLKNEVHTHK